MERWNECSFHIYMGHINISIHNKRQTLVNGWNLSIGNKFPKENQSSLFWAVCALRQNGPPSGLKTSIYYSFSLPNAPY